jgi:F420-0:gamma-glutamyl ligase
MVEPLNNDHSSSKLRRGIDYVGVGVGALIVDNQGRTVSFTPGDHGEE